jgi:hypothetical protein
MPDPQSADKPTKDERRALVSMIKAKFGERLRSKTETAQVNEARKVLCHNLCVVIQSMYELGIAPEFTSEAA